MSYNRLNERLISAVWTNCYSTIMTLDDSPGIGLKDRLAGIARLKGSTNPAVPWNCSLAGAPGSPRAEGHNRATRHVQRSTVLPLPFTLVPGELSSSSITYKRFKRSECQLVNIIIMTSNMARSLHRVTRPAAPETGIRLKHDRTSVVRARCTIAGVAAFLHGTNICSVDIGRFGMFCPAVLLHLRELNRPGMINNLAVAVSSRCLPRRGGRKCRGATDGGGRSLANLWPGYFQCSPVLDVIAPFMASLKS